MAGLMSLLDRSPIPSNIFPKPSSSESSSARSESNSLGGVAVLALLAVLAVLAVKTRSLGVIGIGRMYSWCQETQMARSIAAPFEDFMPTPE